jgi:hypothetical protein
VGHPVFVKRIPVTEREYADPYSTRNLFELPTLYNYGVGSAGFGAYREVITHIKTTNWVLDGSCPYFPITYHHRILPRAGAREPIDEDRHRRYIEYWAGNDAIDRYIRERHDAPYEAVIFLERHEHILGPWLRRHAGMWETIIPQALEAISFLRSQGVIHFDAHFWNIVVTGDTPYFADYGLTLDRSFDLTPEERRYFQRHIDYDFGEFLAGVVGGVWNVYRQQQKRARARVARAFGVSDIDDYAALHPRLVEDIERIHREGVLPLDPGLVASIVRYREIGLLMDGFFHRLQGNPRKDTPYPSRTLRRLLQAAGVV